MNARSASSTGRGQVVERYRRLMFSVAACFVMVAEEINASYVGRVLRLTLLSPGIVEAILDGHRGPEATLDTLMKPFPVAWANQWELSKPVD